jgi:hypothetical protein
MKKENLRFVQMSNYTSPVVKEIRGKDWVEYGEDNNYFQYLIDIFISRNFILEPLSHFGSQSMF